MFTKNQSNTIAGGIVFILLGVVLGGGDLALAQGLGAASTGNTGWIDPILNKFSSGISGIRNVLLVVGGLWVIVLGIRTVVFGKFDPIMWTCATFGLLVVWGGSAAIQNFLA